MPLSPFSDGAAAHAHVRTMAVGTSPAWAAFGRAEPGVAQRCSSRGEVRRLALGDPFLVEKPVICVKNSAWQRPSSGSHASLRPHHAVDASTRTYRAPATAAESCPHRHTVHTHHTPARMGNTMNVAVISQVYQSNRQELLALKKKAEKDGKKTIHREGWEAAEVACSVDESDRDIHERLFTLYDKRGNDEVPSKPFLSGLATITNNTLEERIHIALEIWDEKGSGYLSQEDVQSCFVSMAKTCEYFGDDRMDFEQLVRCCVHVSSPETASSSKKRRPTASSAGDESRRRREPAAKPPRRAGGARAVDVRHVRRRLGRPEDEVPGPDCRLRGAPDHGDLSRAADDGRVRGGL
jgi:Ca2+-binding EF-hand superfamily protein